MPVNVDDAHIFAYFAACSGLYLVFSIFLIEADVGNYVDNGNNQDDDTDVEYDDTATASVTIMAYVTNIRESELVYVKLPFSRFGLAGRRRFHDGFILHNPTFQVMAIQRLPETQVDVSLDNITSWWHIFYAIYGEHRRRVVSFMQESDAWSVFAGRFFVYPCRCLFQNNIISHSVDSTDQVCRFLCDRTQYMYCTRTEFSSDDHFFEHNTGRQTRFKEESVLIARRNTRLWNSNTLQQPLTMSSLHIEHDLPTPTPIIDSFLYCSSQPAQIVSSPSDKTTINTTCIA